MANFNLHTNHHPHHVTTLAGRFLNPAHKPTRLEPNRVGSKICGLSEKTSGVGGGGAIVQQRPGSYDEEAIDIIDQRGEMKSDEMMEDYYVKEYGWKVRRMVEDRSEMSNVALIQAHAFHVPSFFLDDFFFFFFQAEVLSGLLYRLRNSPPDRYACLVAESAKDDDEIREKPPSDDERKLVGVVDVTVLRDKDVLQHLEGSEEYLYVSGIAVANNYRRQKVATVLLKACEVIAVIWGHNYLVLRAYEDDNGARALYTNAGYRLVSRDPPWVTLIGRKRRILMIKRL